jgi:putative transposase
LSTHWHFVVWPKEDSDVTDFFRWLTHTHAMRWRVAHHTVGYGHLYQGRFKSFPVQTDEHLLTVCRYVERNALSAGMVERAERWRYSSLWARANGDEKLKAILTDWPVDQPGDWVEHVNAALSTKEKEQFLMSLKRNRPFGSDAWTQRLVNRLGLEHTIRSEGRPGKERSVAK